MNCIWNKVSADTIIDILNSCSYLYRIEKYNRLSKLVTYNYVVPADNYVIHPDFTEDEKVRLFCTLGNYCIVIKDYRNSLAYYDKLLDINPEEATAIDGKGVSLINLDKPKEAHSGLIKLW